MTIIDGVYYTTQEVKEESNKLWEQIKKKIDAMKKLCYFSSPTNNLKLFHLMT